jgi:hypothetical protein
MKDIVALKSRVAEYIKLGDLLAADDKITGSLSEEQYSCTFHGRDLKKSARYYRDTDSSYCWTCKRRWDIYSYLEQKEAMTFWQAVDYLVKRYNIPTKDLPDAFEESHRKRVEAPKVKVSGGKLALEKIAVAIPMLRGEIPDEKYEMMVFAFMILKHATEESKLAEGAEMLTKGILKIVEEAQGGE